MAWLVEITIQERGTKKEAQIILRFEDEAPALDAVRKLESDLSAAASDDFVIVEAPKQRSSIIKQDYRRNRLFEYTPRTPSIR